MHKNIFYDYYHKRDSQAFFDHKGYRWMFFITGYQQAMLPVILSEGFDSGNIDPQDILLHGICQGDLKHGIHTVLFDVGHIPQKENDFYPEIHFELSPDVFQQVWEEGINDKTIKLQSQW